MPNWLPWVVGIVGGVCLGVIWLVALSVLVNRWQLRKQVQRQVVEPTKSMGSGTHSSASLAPIRSFLEPDDDEPHTPLPSQTMAPLSFDRYVEVRGAIAGWSDCGEDVQSQLTAVFGIELRAYEEAHRWWMSALDGADDRLDEIQRRAEVFAQRYGGQTP